MKNSRLAIVLILIISTSTLLIYQINQNYPSDNSNQNNNPDNSDQIVDSQNNTSWIVENLFLYSSIIDFNFTIQVGLPPRYSSNSTNSYHSLYLLDGMYYFDDQSQKTKNGGVLQIIKDLVGNETIPETILIGIGYPDDYWHREIYLHEIPRQFRRFMIDELIPLIDEKYKTDRSPTNKTLIGHSAGASFAVHCLIIDGLENEKTFGNFIAVSGAYDTTRKPYKDEETLSKQEDVNAFIDRKLFISVGVRDSISLPWGIDPVLLIDAHREFIIRLIEHNYSRLDLNTTEYPERGHWNIQEEAFRDGIKWVYRVIETKVI